MLKPEEQKVVDACKRALLKQLHLVRHNGNNYPTEAVAKATILGLDFLVELELRNSPPIDSNAKDKTDSITT